ncbi:MAG: LptA/OstA family protein [Caulobacterales bacterium]
MSSLRQTAAAALAIAAACIAAPASAQIGKSGGPVDIESDSLQVVDAERKAVFSGNVDAQQGDSRLKSRRLTVYFGAKKANATGNSTGDALGASFGEIDKLLAEGDVLYLTPTERARGDTGVYEMKTDTITLTGGVIVTRGDNVIKGDRMVIEVSSGKTTITSNARSTTGKPPRVRGVFQPSSKPTAAPAATAPSAPAAQ